MIKYIIIDAKNALSIKIPAGFSLLEDEKPLWHGRISLKSNWLLILIGLLTLIIVIGVLLLIIVALKIMSSEYFITNRRIYVKYGLIGRRTVELKNEWVTNFSVTQGVFGRILNYGIVDIATPGARFGSTRMVGVADPMRVKSIVPDIIQKSKKAQEIKESIRRIDEEYNLGRVEKVKYESLRAKYEDEMKKYQ